MSWTEIIRLDYDRRGLCYVSDVTDGEWALSSTDAPLIASVFDGLKRGGLRLKQVCPIRFVCPRPQRRPAFSNAPHLIHPCYTAHCRLCQSSHHSAA
jgi:hypothetical protein